MAEAELQLCILHAAQSSKEKKVVLIYLYLKLDLLNVYLMY